MNINQELKHLKKVANQRTHNVLLNDLIRIFIPAEKSVCTAFKSYSRSTIHSVSKNNKVFHIKNIIKSG